MITFERWRVVDDELKEMFINDYSGLCNYERSLLMDNVKIFNRFLFEAHAVADKREHYSARTIVEVLRHNSLAHDNHEKYKISNDITPIMAYASMQMFPSLNGFFKTRAKRSKHNVSK